MLGHWCMALLERDYYVWPCWCGCVPVGDVTKVCGLIVPNSMLGTVSFSSYCL